MYDMCMSFGRRFQILLDDGRYERLAAAARERHVSVAAVIRAAIDVALPSDEGRKRAAVKVILEADPMPVPARVEELKAELDELHAKGF